MNVGWDHRRGDYLRIGGGAMGIEWEEGLGARAVGVECGSSNY